jgi:kynurenine formamidase
MSPKNATAQEIKEWHKTLSNWGRWGKEDQLGTINLITPQKRLEATRLVKKGLTVSLARPIVAEPSLDAAVPPQLYMVESGEGMHDTPGKPESPSQGAMEYIGMVYHGMIVTHVDALCHMFADGKMYNGFPSHAIRTRTGASMESIDNLKDGVVTRGVLLDFPTLKGVPYMKPGEAIYPEDLDAAEKKFGVKVGPGDVLIIRSGNWERRKAEGPNRPMIDGGSGLQASCLPWLKQRDIAMLGGDLAQDVMPSGYQEYTLPVHRILLTAMGCWILDNCNLEDLARVCKQENRYEFMLVVNPLRLANGTGAPVNPIAIF